ncbi:MAG: SBBP repeat-containing protein [Deltaproteobacteria bacterium]|nr:SBBP repeat-containing protein [Deltaproteobacteria bacterium]
MIRAERAATVLPWLLVLFALLGLACTETALPPRCKVRCAADKQCPSSAGHCGEDGYCHASPGEPACPATVSITREGSGSGRVTSDPPGIDCGAQCSAAFPITTPITLRATPDPSSVFTGWSDACAALAEQDGTCKLSVKTDVEVSASFVVGSPLEVRVHGAGSVTSSPAGIECQGDCERAFLTGSDVALTATPAPGASFFGWAGPCKGTEPCRIKVDAKRTVGAWFAQAELAWARGAGGPGLDRGMDVVVDPQGFLLVTGAFSDEMDLGGGPLKAVGSTDIFVAKLSPSGEHVWSRGFGGPGGDEGTLVDVDSKGNVVVTGTFMDTITLGGSLLKAQGTSDVLVAKFSADGEHLWSMRIGGPGTDSDSYVTIDRAGEIYVLGTYKDTLEIGNESLPSQGAREMFLVKLSPDGELRWARRFGGTSEDFAKGIAVDPDGNILVLGVFSNVASLGGAPLSSKGGDDIALAKLSPGGEHLWSKSYGGGGNDDGASLVVDAAGSLVLAGSFLASIDFGGGTLESGGGQAAFVVKLDADGTHAWSRRFASQGGAVAAQDLAINARGQVVVTGRASGPTDFGTGALNVAGGNDIFVAGLSETGMPRWARVLGGVGEEGHASVDVDTQGAMILSGSFSGPADFAGKTLASAGSRDVYLAKLTDALVGQWVKGFGDAGWTESYACRVDSGGNLLLTGYFTGTVDFGGDVMSSTAEGDDLFVAKLSPLGELAWSRSPVAPGADYGILLALDKGDNVLISGYFSDSIDFGKGPMLSAGAEDGFVAKFSPQGEPLWSRTIGGEGSDFAYVVKPDRDGNVFVGGFFTGTVDFGAGPATSEGGEDSFLVKLAPDGKHVWSRTFGGGGEDNVYAIGVSNDGTVALAGYSDSATITLAGGEPIATAGGHDVLLAAFSSDGDPLWARTYGDVGDDISWAIAATPSGGWAMAGYFSEKVDFGGGPFTGIPGSNDLFVLQVDGNGEHEWSHGFQGSGFDRGNAVDVDADGNVLVIGQFENTLDLGGPDLLQSNGMADIISLKFDKSGKLLWGRAFGGPGDDIGYGIAADGAHVVLTGNFQQEVDFWTAPLVSAGSFDVFLGRYWAERFP